MFSHIHFIEVVVVQWHNRVTVNATVVGSIPTRGSDNF